MNSKVIEKMLGAVEWIAMLNVCCKRITGGKICFALIVDPCGFYFSKVVYLNFFFFKSYSPWLYFPSSQIQILDLLGFDVKKKINFPLLSVMKQGEVLLHVLLSHFKSQMHLIYFLRERPMTLVQQKYRHL